MEPVDGLPPDGGIGTRPVAGQQIEDHLVIEQCLVRFVLVELELIAACAVRTRQRDAWAAWIAKHAGVLLRIFLVLQIDDQPALLEGRALERDSELFAHRAARTVAADQIRAALFALRAGAVREDGGDRFRALDEFLQPPAERGAHRRKAREIVPQFGFQHGLMEGIAARIAVRHSARLHDREAPPVGSEVMRTVARNDVGHQRFDDPHGLHDAQRLVVDRNRPRLRNGGRIALDQQHADTKSAQQVGQRQSCRATADDGDWQCVIRSRNVAHAPIIPGQPHPPYYGVCTVGRSSASASSRRARFTRSAVQFIKVCAAATGTSAARVGGASDSSYTNRSMRSA